MSAEVGVMAVDGGELTLGGGLLALVRPALDALQPGGILAVLSRSVSVREDLPSWCRAGRHEYLGVEETADGLDRHLIVRGAFSVPRETSKANGSLKPRDRRLTAADLLEAAVLPPSADPVTGFAPRGARVEPGGPSYPFTLNERDHVAPPEVAMLYDQAVSGQWNASTDIPWSKVRPLPDALESALVQIMTFLAENELSALYVPSRFIARIHPAFAEVAMFLATQLADEARHIDVFLKRARLCGQGLGISSVTTSRSLLSLLQIEDFTEAAFLLSVLGEGTFLDLLSFIERHAPDEPTAELVRRARSDESRHVHFGMAHVRFGLTTDPTLYGRLEAAVRRRAAGLHGIGGVPAPLQDALTILAAGSAEPGAIARGHESFRQLLETMHLSRIRRLGHAGFTHQQAELISELHTPNFM
ncbi:MAG: ferritin-like domain-containing protein [Pyrinomonadaceae bacterium]